MWMAIAEHAGTFLFGVGVGLLLSSRYRIVRVDQGADDASKRVDAIDR